MMIAAIACALLLAQAVTPGMPPRPGGSAPAADTKGTAVIKGRITAADTGRPLRRARITVTGAPLPTSRATSTNVRGEYELRDLPAGTFQVTVQRSGYLPMTLGQRFPGEPGKPLEIADGATTERIDFALPRAGIVSGRVVDETGEPVAGVTVWTMRLEYFRGRRRYVPASSGTRTDDTGQYRILNVVPGEYVVMAWLRETWKAGPERQTFGYAPTFFPGTATVTDATRVKVGVAQEAANIDMALAANRAAVLSGTATAADGTPLAGAQVSLSQEFMGSSGGMSTWVTTATVAPDGSWRMRDVPPGEYELDVSWSERDRPPARASQTVIVQGADVEGVALVADRGGTITGQLVADGGMALPPFPTRPRVVADPTKPGARPFVALMSDENGMVGTDGRFTFTGATGRSAIRVSPLPQGWVVKSIDAGDRDYTATPIDVRGGQAIDVRIVITNRFPEVSGRITDDKGNPAEGTVLLFPEEGERWFDTAVLRSARPDQTGIFRIRNVRPGDYLAVALEYVQSWQMNDPEFLEALRDRATRVTVREGQPEMLTLKVR